MSGRPVKLSGIPTGQSFSVSFLGVLWREYLNSSTIKFADALLLGRCKRNFTGYE